LFKGHYVLAISRSGKFDNHPQLESIHCDVFDEEKLVEVLRRADLVISSYNSGWTNPNLYQEYIDGSKHITNVVKRLGVRVIYIGGASSLLQQNGEPLYHTTPQEWKDKVKGAYDLFELIKEDQS